ncbi:hypothetical protein TRV_05730 [Trichophyton verrucosum HKI 0517]|uniref:Uncharacterized protein n=1 Tax=Trichophyton verrucosum (strain HKI 0517) TaxID=663202 RepID=D4DEY9_TRIVH|nr:uncharacterized protein TRV_05730 [Trichophyton verrucosum HKI 0517]EFE39584.1 hypothetical protein TRV_05730 [Trichophyton verrucosum HKI 0517]
MSCRSSEIPVLLRFAAGCQLVVNPMLASPLSHGLTTARKPSSASSMDEPASYPVSSLAGFIVACCLLVVVVVVANVNAIPGQRLHG